MIHSCISRVTENKTIQFIGQAGNTQCCSRPDLFFEKSFNNFTMFILKFRL